MAASTLGTLTGGHANNTLRVIVYYTIEDA
jgi:hypothetical protein